MNGPKYKDYYRILGVGKTADEKDIKAAYRKLARKYHPDVNPGDAGSEEKFKEISEAYDVLGDPHKRAQYDSFGDQWKQYSQAGARPGGSPFGSGPFGGGQQGGLEFDLGSGGAGLNDLFESLFGGRKTRANRATSKGEDVEFGIDVSLEDVVSGTVREQSVSVEDVCTECQGLGSIRRGRGAFDVGASCPQCRGRGRTGRQRRIKVKVPAGVEDGKRLCLKGQGGSGGDGSKGDLYLVVRIKPHGCFERQDRDLFTDVEVPYTVAALGGELSVKTLAGDRTLSIPAGIQSGQKVRVAGQGLPASAGRPGDLYVRVKVSVPKDLAPRERELLTELALLRGDQVRS